MIDEPLTGLDEADNEAITNETAAEVVAAIKARLGLDAPIAGTVVELALDALTVPDEEHVRRGMRSMSASFDLVAMMHTPAVVLTAPGAYKVVAGARRVLSARDHGDARLECRVYAGLDEEREALLTLAENINRAPAWVRELQALVKLTERGPLLTDRELAVLLNRPLGSIREVRKLAKLPELLLERIFAGHVSHRTAKQLAHLTLGQQDRVCDRIAGGEELTDDLVREALRAQVAASFSASLFPQETARPKEAASAPESDATPTEASSAPPIIHFDPKRPEGLVSALKALALDPTTPQRVRVLASALAGELS